MSRNRTESGIASHTQYVRSRVRCPGCGGIVPDDGARADGSLCVRCRD